MGIKVTIPAAIEKRLLRMIEFSSVEMAHLPQTRETPGSYSATTARQILALIEDARSRKKVVKGGLSPAEAIRIIRSVLGPSAALPPVQTPAFYASIKKRINFLGLSAEDVERAAIRAKHTYRLPTSVHYIMQTIDRLVGDAVEVREPSAEVTVTTGRDNE